MDAVSGVSDVYGARVEAALLDTLLSSLDVGVVLQDADRTVLAVNQAAERMLGLRPQQMSGEEPVPEGWATLHEDGWPLPPESRPTRVALRTGMPIRDAVVGVKKPDGSVRWLSLNVQPLFHDGEDAAYAVATSLMDVTDTRDAESAERRIADRFRSLIEYSSDFITILDERGRIVYASPSIEKILGYPPGELQGTEQFSLVHPDDVADAAQSFASLLGRPGESVACECRFRASDGSWLIAESIGTNRLHDPAVMGIVVNTRDLSARRAAEAALRDTSSRLGRLVENIQAGLLVEDEDRRVVLANADFCAIFGIDAAPDSLAGSDSRAAQQQALALLAEPDGFEQRVDELIAARRPVRGEEIAFADGRTFERDYIPISVDRDDRGNLWIYRDITHRKDAEREAARVRDEAIRASRVKSEFLATMSHEIRTPINGVIGTIELLLDTSLSPEQQELAGVVRDSAYTLLGVIDSVLDLSKIEAEKLEPKDVEFDLTAVAEGVADVVLSPARRKGLWLTTYVDPRISSRLRGDAQWLRQVLLNLASNAVKFTEVGEVHIRAELEAGTGRSATVRFSVTDSGVGIPAEARERLFEPFAQLDSTSTRRHGGTGLGLAICQRLVRLMGGEIEVESEPGRGSTFSFALSFRRAGAEPPRPAPARELRVLVAEACDGTARVTREYLSAWGLESERVTSGQDALRRVALAAGSERAFDVAILGTSLPEPVVKVAEALRDQAGGEQLVMVLLRDFGPGGSDVPALAGTPFASDLTKPVKQAPLFEAVLGVADPLARSQRHERPEPLVAPAEDGELSGARVLVAEDNEVNRELLVRQLAKLGIEAEGVESGREAIAAATSGVYDVVLMDCHMPEIDGYQATRAIRAAEDGGAHRTSIVAVTASAFVEDREACLAVGMDECLTKPLTTAGLARAIRDCLSGTRPSGAIDQTALDRLEADLGAGPELARILGIYVEQLPLARQRLRAAVQGGDAAELARAAHTLASSSANFGARELSELAGRLERMGRSGTTDGAAEVLEMLERECAAAESELAARLERDAQRPDSSR